MEKKNNYVDNPFKSPAVLSLCTGMRGLERGIERALAQPIRVLTYVEIEAFVIENLVQQMEQGILAPAPVFSNAKTFPFHLFRNKLHWIIGGYPCQPFSHAGLRAGADDPRHLWPFFKSGIKKSRPVGVFFENVEGHLSLGLRDVLTDLRKLGYQTEVGLFSAAEVGAPHRRNRIFILGLENSYLLGNGRRDIEEWLRKVEVQAQGSGIMDNSSIDGPESQYEISTGRNSVESAGEGNMENTEGVGCGSQRAESERLKRSTIIDDANLDHTSGKGLQGGHKKEDSIRFEGSWGSTSSRTSRWPARPGESQHEWEAPRLESSLGYTINGYNFREDLLRMAGNAVVEQQAELAFRTLIQKFL